LLRSGPVDDATLQGVLDDMRLPPEAVREAAWIDNGPGWVGLLLADADAVLAVRPGPRLSADIGLVGFHPDDHEAAYEVRAFFTKNGATAEDPVTGSLNASVAQWMVASGRVQAPYLATQGTVLGRSGRVTVSVEPETGDGESAVWIGGSVAMVVRGSVDLGEG
jgi:PhzF family phenazine biosynthesis protein